MGWVTIALLSTFLLAASFARIRKLKQPLETRRQASAGTPPPVQRLPKSIEGNDTDTPSPERWVQVGRHPSSAINPDFLYPYLIVFSFLNRSDTVLLCFSIMAALLLEAAKRLPLNPVYVEIFHHALVVYPPRQGRKRLVFFSSLASIEILEGFPDDELHIATANGMEIVRLSYSTGREEDWRAFNEFILGGGGRRTRATRRTRS